MLNHGSRESARSFEPCLAGCAAIPDGLQDVVGRRAFAELAIHTQFHGAFGEPPQFVVGTEDFGFHAGHHARDRLVADFRERFFAEVEKGEVGAVPEQQKLEVVVPHPEVTLECFLVRVQNVVIRGDAAARVNVLQRFEFRKHRFRKGLRVADELHHLFLPLREQPFPVRVIVEGALLEFLRAPRDLRRIGDAVSADVEAPVDNPAVDAERGRQGLDARVRRAERDVGRFRCNRVEDVHRLGEVHRVVEPKALVVILGELHVVRIGGLRPLGTRDDVQRTGKREALGLIGYAHDHPSSRRIRSAQLFPWMLYGNCRSFQRGFGHRRDP